MKPENLQRGDWISIEYGLIPTTFYVLRNDPSNGVVILGNPRWEFGDIISPKHTNRVFDPLVFLGHGKYKWYWRLLPWRNTTTPFYSPLP